MTPEMKGPRNIILLGAKGTSWFPLFQQFRGNTVAAAEFLIRIFEGTEYETVPRMEPTIRYGHPFRLLRAAVIFAKARFGDEFGGFEGLAESLCTVLYSRSDRKMLEAGDPCPKRRDTANALISGYQRGRIERAELADILAYLDNQLPPDARCHWQEAAKIAARYGEQFRHPAFSEVFCASEGKKAVAPEEFGNALIVLCLDSRPQDAPLQAIAAMLDLACETAE